MSSLESHPPRLVSSRFIAFLTAQFLGAANDNAFKIVLTLLIIRLIPDPGGQVRLSGLATLLFPLPFILFAPIAGYLADRFNKGRLLAVTKAPELAAMALAIPALATRDLGLLLAVLFLMATQSAFFSPVKYGLLPESLPASRLSMANGVLQMTTNMAILAGSAGGVLLFDRFSDAPGRIGWVLFGVAVAGTVAATHAPRTPPGSVDTPVAWNVARTAVSLWREVRRQPALLHTIVGIAYFSFLGALFLTVVPAHARSRLGLGETASGTLLMVLSIGVALGSLIAGKLSQGRIELGLVPIGSLGLSLFALDLSLFGTGWVHEFPGLGPLPLRALMDLTLLGAAAGLYVVPLNSMLQERGSPGMKGQLIAFSNLLSAFAILSAGAVSILTVGGLRFSTTELILATAVLSLLVTAYIFRLLPMAFVRLVLWLLVHTFYRINVEGGDRLPRGGGLLVANHVSWMDALLIGAATDRMVRFMMYRPFFEARPLRGFFRMMRVIPVAGGDSPELKEASLARAREEIDAGHLVCIFAEGSITRTGNLLRFRRGFERIMAGSDAPIVPVCLDGIWGSVFSWDRGRLLFKRPRRHSDPVRVIFGPAMPASARAFEVRQQVQELSVRAFEQRRSRLRPLQVGFARTAKRFRRRPFLASGGGRRLAFGPSLERALALRSVLFGDSRGQDENVGVLLQPGIPGALADLAVLCAGKTVVHLPEGGGGPAIARLARLAGVRRIITAPRYLTELDADEALSEFERISIGAAESAIPAWTQLGYSLAVKFLPRFLVMHLVDGDPRDVERAAAIVFSRGASGRGPERAVVLSHRNILSDMESLKQVFRLSREDRILGTVSLGNAFGLVGTLLLPAVAGIRVAYHSNPKNAPALCRMVRGLPVTVVPIGPDQLASFFESLPAESFRAARHVVVAGGEPDEALQRGFAEKFGLEPLIGFGCAECGPLVSLNVPSRVRGAQHQAGPRKGTVGQPLPGVAVRIVDPQNGSLLPPDRVGLLLVRGANVASGYLDDPESTARDFRDGWFRTGLRASQDADGFLTLHGPIDRSR